MTANAFRKGARTDAEHAAIATVERAIYLLSRDYTDLVNVRAQARINAVNLGPGYAPLILAAPPEFIGINHVQGHATKDETGSRASRPCHIFKGDD
jgi:hypothetical protein